MISWQPIKPKDQHVGTVGYVECTLNTQKTLILCQSAGRQQIEIAPIKIFRKVLE